MSTNILINNLENIMGEHAPMNSEADVENSTPCDLVIMPHGTGIYTGDTDTLLSPRTITITDVRCGTGHRTVSLDDLVTFYEQYIEL